MRIVRSKRARAALASGALVALGLILLWSARAPIAAGIIARELATRGISARYHVASIGARTQRIEALSIGSPARPDLTADAVEIELEPTWQGVRVVAVRAVGVRLRGRLANGRLRLGEIEKLLPTPTGKAFSLPPIDVDLRDAQAIVASDYGNLGIRLDGRGRLDSGFKGRAVIAAAALGRGDCHAIRPRAFLNVAAVGGRPQVTGPIKAARVDCSGITAPTLDATLDARFASDLSLTRATASVAAPVASGDRMVIAQPRATLTTVPSGRAFGLRINSMAAQGRYHDVTLDRLDFAGNLRSVEKGWALRGMLTAGRYRPDARLLAEAQAALNSTGGTPIGPIAVQLSQAVARLGLGLSGRATIALEQIGGRTALAVDQADVVSASGARATLALVSSPRDIAGDAGRQTVSVRLNGGGFPRVDAEARDDGGAGWRGVVRIASMRAPGAKVDIAPIRVAARSDGTVRIESNAVVSGPFGTGRVEGLRLPIVAQRSADGIIIVQPGCAPLSFEHLAVAGVSVRATSTRVCPTNGVALFSIGPRATAFSGRVDPLRMGGSIGDSPLSVRTAGATISAEGFGLSELLVRLGIATKTTRFDVARIDGSWTKGRFTGLSGQIGSVPLAVDRGVGTWRFERGSLAIGGGIRVSDTAQLPRFHPLVSCNAALTLKGGVVGATATLREPRSDAAVASIVIAHVLANGTGNARIAVSDLSFGKQLQPETITPLTLGVIANVQGRIDGSGSIRWTPQGVTSDGRFRTTDLDLAAAFGPVSGISGEVVFDDLLSLTTPPGQRARVRLINPGIEVKDGTIDYRLLARQRIVVERGRWPFAGGELLLDPATLDFGKPVTRKLTFRLVGLDAAKFIEQLKLENLAATGTFDGALPVAFDGNGGRIEGGRVVARSGGTLAYVGDVSNAAMNSYAKLAFDALKSMRYDNLAIDLDGALDGEVVSRVNFTGINQSPAAAPGTLAKKFSGLPFKFNIVVRAPFRGLVGTARGLQDPRTLLEAAPAVQPPATGTRP